MFLENIIHMDFFLIAESGQEIHSQENTMFLDVRSNYISFILSMCTILKLILLTIDQSFLEIKKCIIIKKKSINF